MATTKFAAASSPDEPAHRKNAALLRATHHPKLNPQCPVFQASRDRFEALHFPDGMGLDTHVTRATEVYMEYRARAVIRMVTRLMTASGQNLQELADFL